MLVYYAQVSTYFWTFSKFIGNISISTFSNQQQQKSFTNAAITQNIIKYVDSYYSTYQTEDKKYECKTVPFEGFFVSSVEYCKIKFNKDDSKINRT